MRSMINPATFRSATRACPVANAWAAKASAHQLMAALPAEATDEQAAPLQEIIDRCEAVMESTPARSLEGVSAQLLAAFAYMAELNKPELHRAAIRGDLDALEAAGLDWPERLAVAALRSLREMSATRVGDLA